MDVTAQGLFDQVLSLIYAWGGIPFTLKVSGIILVVVSMLKVTAFRPMWDFLGPCKAFLCAFLALLGGIFSLGQNMTAAGILAYLFSGAGAVVLHEMLDQVKLIPGIGPQYIMIIN